MKEWDAFVSKAIEQGFSVALKWTNGNLTYSLFSPSGAVFGRGFKWNEPYCGLSDGPLSILAESGLKTMDFIKDEKPDAMIEELFVK